MSTYLSKSPLLWGLGTIHRKWSQNSLNLHTPRLCSRNNSVPEWCCGRCPWCLDEPGFWSAGYYCPSDFLCIGEKYGFYSWPTMEIFVFNEPSSKIPGAGKGTQRNVQRNIPKSWRNYSCLSPPMGLNTALLRNTWITWTLPGMEAALCGLQGAGAEPGHGLWTLQLTRGSHVHLGSCQYCRNNHGDKAPSPPTGPWLPVIRISCRTPRRSHSPQQLKLSPSQNQHKSNLCATTSGIHFQEQNQPVWQLKCLVNQGKDEVQPTSRWTLGP